MQKHAVLSLCLAFWWLALTSPAMAATPDPATTAPASTTPPSTPTTPAPAPATNAAPEYQGPVSLQATAGTELEIAKTKPISIHDENNNLKEVKLEVKEGTLSITGVGNASITGPNTKQMTLSGTETDINKALKTLTYKNNPNIQVGEDKLTVNASDDANKKMDEKTITITIIQKTAASKVCVPTNKPSGGVEDFLGNWAAGPTLSYSLVQYNLADKKSSFNARAAGAGISFRYYSDAQLANVGASMGRPRYSLTQEGLKGTELTKITSPPGEGQKWAEWTQVTEVPSECRAQTYEFGEVTKAHSWISVSPTMYAFQDKNADNFAVQFALNFGFFDDIFTVGAGWNLSGDNAGEWFILAGPSIGFGF